MPKRALAASLLLLSLMVPPAWADTAQDAQALIRQGQYAQALEKLDPALAARPKDAQLRFLRGVALSELNRANEAISIFQKLTEDYPELPEPYNNLAVLYAQQRQYEKARQSLELAIRTHPSYATAHENLGDIYARLASQAYDKALALDSSNLTAQNKLSMIKEMMTVGGKTVRPVAPPVAAPPPKPAPVAAVPAVAPAPVPVAPATPSPSPSKPAAAPSVATAPSPAAPPAQPKTPSIAALTPSAQTAPPAPAVSKNDPKATAKAPEPKDETAAVAPAVTRMVQSWATVWSRKDVKAYLAHYARDFTPPKGLSRKAWEEERQQRLTKPGPIEVDLENIKIVSSTGNRVTVRLRQNYKSANLSTSSTKTLELIQQDGKWLIAQERVGG